MKPFKCIVVLSLILLPVVGHPQSPDAGPILREDDFLAALLAIDNEVAALALLKKHQQSITPHLWNRLVDEAINSSNGGSTARALSILEVAKAAAEQLGDKRRLADTYYRMGYVQFAHGDDKPAIDAYLLSKKLFEETDSRRDLVYVLSDLGNVLILTGEYKEAEKHSEESLALAASSKTSRPAVNGLPDKYGIAHAWSNLAEVSSWKGDYPEAVDRFQRSLELWEALNRGGSAYRSYIIDTLTNIGIAYRRIGDHTQALHYWNRALELARTAEDKGRSAAALVSIGVLYLDQRDYSKADEFLNESLRLFIEVNDKREIAAALVNIGVMKQRLADYDQATDAFQRALERADQIGATDLVVTAQEGLGVVYYEQGKYEAALEWFEKGWSLAQRIGDKIRMTELLWRKGQVFFSQGNYERASASANSASDLASRLRSPLLTYLTLTLLGESHLARGEHGDAAGSFTQAIEAVEHMRDQIAGAEKEQQLFFEDKLTPYHEMVSLLARSNKAEDALEYAERAKGRVLLDVLRNGRTNVNKSVSDSEQSTERRLYSDMISLNTQIVAEKLRQQPDDKRIGELDGRLQGARNAYERFQTGLYAAHPELKANRGRLSVFTMADAAALVPDSRTAILEYVVTDEQTLLFVLTRNSRTKPKEIEITVHPIRIKRKDLSNVLEEYRSLLSTNDPGFHKTGRELYDLLIRPAEADIKGKATICIVPDGPLWNLPFQALKTANRKYLLEQYAMYYVPSLSVLREMRKRAGTEKTLPLSKREAGGGASRMSAHRREDLYAIGNPAFGAEAVARAINLRNAPFVALPEAEKEVRALASDVYGPQSSLVRIGLAASEESVKAEMGRYRVLHFATHGVLDNRDPLYSYIALSPSSDGKEDGLLEAWELMEMDLKAELAVLSACDTARGHVGDGEGMIGVTWAFFVAGVPTTIASQWQVPSESTTKLMLRFHRNLRRVGSKRVSKAEAWRQAALETMNDPGYRMHPYYWAGFVVVGDGGR